MHVLLDEVGEAVSFDGGSIRAADMGEMQVTVETYDQDYDTTPLFAGLPGDKCQCPHWGYVRSGRLIVTYESDEEVITAGEVFYLEPGHTIAVEAGTEYITFSPTEEFYEMGEHVVRNLTEILE